MKNASYLRRSVPWILGGLEVLFLAALTLWILIWPPAFRHYYPAVQGPAYVSDANIIVNWLASTHRERTLNLDLGGKLVPAELHHYADVRRVFRWFPLVAGALGGLLLLTCALARPSRTLIQASQLRGLILWSLVLVAIGGLAWWDWKKFFALLHHPFFGDTSWRLPDNAYSLTLFPARFWKWTAGSVLLTPLICVTLAAIILARPSPARQHAPSPSSNGEGSSPCPLPKETAG